MSNALTMVTLCTGIEVPAGTLTHTTFGLRVLMRDNPARFTALAEHVLNGAPLDTDDLAYIRAAGLLTSGHVHEVTCDIVRASVDPETFDLVDPIAGVQ